MVFPLAAVLAFGSAAIGASSASKSANAQKAAADQQAQIAKEQFNAVSKDLAPYRDVGKNFLNTYQMGIGTSFDKSPGYQFGLDQGLDAIGARAAATGMYNSGATQKAMMGYGQDYANGEYNNWLNRVQGAVNMGQSASAMQANNSSGYVQNATNAFNNYGNAAAAGAIGVGNALQGGINTGLGIWQYQNGLQNQNQGGAVNSSIRPMARPI